MALIEYTLEGKENKVETAINSAPTENERTEMENENTRNDRKFEISYKR